MRKCPFSAEDIPDAAIAGTHYKRELSTQRTQKKGTMACPFCEAVAPKGNKGYPACGDDRSGVAGALQQRSQRKAVG